MKDQKYIVCEYMDPKMQVPMDGGFTFPNSIDHDRFALIIGATEIYGAGFCRVQDGELICFGKSFSLDKPSRGQEDARWLGQKS